MVLKGLNDTQPDPAVRSSIGCPKTRQGDSHRRLCVAPGDLVRIVPNHSCPVSNLVDRAWKVDGVGVLGKLEVAARGRIE